MLKRTRKAKDLALEGKRAQQYDAFSREYRKRDFQEFAALAASYLEEGASVLEVAAGPGYFCIELGKLGEYRITGLDISSDLVMIARSNASRAEVTVDFVPGNASSMQFPDATFDLVFCSWAVKNFKEPTKVLGEMHRVLKPKGMAIIVDLSHEATTRDWKGYAEERGLKGATAMMMRVAFLIQRSGAYSTRQFEELLEGAPFRQCEIRSCGINLCITLGK